MRFLVLSTFCGSFPPHAPGIGLNNEKMVLVLAEINPIPGACGGKPPQKIDMTSNLINIVSTTSVFLDFS